MSGKQLLGGALALGFVFAGATVAQATTYFFTYNGFDGSSILNGTIVYSGGMVTGASGTINFVGDPSGSGSITNFVGDSGSVFTNVNSYDFNFQVVAGANHQEQIALISGFGNSQLYDFSDNGGHGNIGSSTISTTAPAPAPIPGGGPLSFLALGIGALAYRRKQIAGIGRMSCRKMSKKLIALAG